MHISRLQMKNGCELTVRIISDGKNDGDAFETKTPDTDTTGIPIIMWGGIFGTYLVWSRLAKMLRNQHSLVMIDYPSYALSSQLFADKTLDVPMLAAFQYEAMAQLHMDRAVVMGWSYGTQVAAEFAITNPQKTAALVMISGVAGKPFSHISDPIFETIGIRPKVAQTMGWLSKKEEALSRLRKIIQRNEHPSRWGKRLGLVAPSVDELIMDAVIRDFANMSGRHYNFYLQASTKHDATAALKKTDIPILGISGNLDKLVPAKRTREFIKKNSSNEFMLVKGGTHFVPLEYSKLVALKIEDFLKRNRIKK